MPEDPNHYITPDEEYALSHQDDPGHQAPPSYEEQQHIVAKLARRIWAKRGGGQSAPDQQQADWKEAERQYLSKT